MLPPRDNIPRSIWECAIVQALIYNAEVWTDIADTTIESLDSVQNLFLRLVVFDTPASSPRSAAVWDTATEGMKTDLPIHVQKYVSDEAVIHEILELVHIQLDMGD